MIFTWFGRLRGSPEKSLSCSFVIIYINIINVVAVRRPTKTNVVVLFSVAFSFMFVRFGFLSFAIQLTAITNNYQRLPSPLPDTTLGNFFLLLKIYQLFPCILVFNGFRPCSWPAQVCPIYYYNNYNVNSTPNTYSVSKTKSFVEFIDQYSQGRF